MDNMSVQKEYTQNIYTQNTDKKEKTIAPAQGKEKDKEKVKKAIVIASAAAAAAGIATVAIIKHKNTKAAKQAAEKLIQNAAGGNNKVLSEAIQKEDEIVQKFIQDNPRGWDKLKKHILNMIDIKKADDVLGDAKIYHGTDVKSAKNILEKGVTPFSAKRAGSASGMGYGIYTTPHLEAAKYYSQGGVVMPYKIEGNIAVLKDTYKNPQSFMGEISGKIMEIIDPPKAATKGSLSYIPNTDAVDFAQKHLGNITTKAMKEIGVDSIYTDAAVTKGLLSSVFGKTPEFLDNAGQLVVFDGAKLKFNPQEFMNLNGIEKLAGAFKKG